MFEHDVNGSNPPHGTVVIHHVCVKSPDLQIERPYTPINDPAKDGYMDIVVKRVKGGEVGRWVRCGLESWIMSLILSDTKRFVHSLQQGDDIELRGPIVTTRIPLAQLQEVDLVSLLFFRPL